MFAAFLMKVLDYLLSHACISTFIQQLPFECLSLRTRDLKDQHGFHSQGI